MGNKEGLRWQKTFATWLQNLSLAVFGAALVTYPIYSLKYWYFFVAAAILLGLGAYIQHKLED
ncbi:MAG: hypothetical protein KGH66_03690 [Candidatus Micrarchaeota archaeon]|nr:hypothetical protein [Candidatus Micrarchaeota archaeon]